MDFLIGNKDFRTEKLTAFELGTRVQPASGLSLSLSGYYNLYDDLRSVEFTPITLLPLYWGNKLKGHSYGLDAWVDYRVASWWKLSAGAQFLHEKLHFKPGATGQVRPRIKEGGVRGKRRAPPGRCRTALSTV